MKKVRILLALVVGLALLAGPAAVVLAGSFGPITVTDQTPTAPLANPAPSSFQPRYISGFGSDNSFTVFFEDRDAGGTISYASTTSGPTGFPASATATNIADTHFCVKDWPINIGGTDYAYRAWGSVGNNMQHHFYVSNDLTNWTLVSTFTIPNAASFTDAHGWVYYGFHDVIELNGTYYAFAESNQSQTMIVRSANGDDVWEAFASVGGRPGDGPLELPSGVAFGWTPSGNFVDLGHDRGYGKIHVDPRDSNFYLAVNTAAKPSLPAADLEAAFINPANWTWHDGTTGPAANPILSATSEHDIRECWVVPNTDPDADWVIVYDADFGSADGGKALGYATLSPPTPPPDTVCVDDDFVGSSPGESLDGSVCGMGTVTFGYDAFATIQEGIDAVSGSTVHVAAGTYTPAATIAVNKSVTLRGPQAGVDPRPSKGTTRTPGSASEAIVDGGGTLSRIFRITASDVVLDGLEIRNATGDMIDSPSSAGISNVTLHYNIIRDALGDEGVQLRDCANCVIEFNHAFDIAQDGINLCCGSTGGIIQSNEVHANSSENAAIYVYGSTNTTIQCNLVYDVLDNDGIKLGSKNGGDASGTGGSIRYNVVHDTRQDGISVYMSNTLVDGNEVYNSTSENGAVYLAHEITNITVVDNDVYDNILDPGKWGDPGSIMIGTGVDATTVAVNNNNITGNSVNGVTNKAIALLNAQSNWWGAADGPSGAGSGSGDGVSTNVDFGSWLAGPAQPQGVNPCPEKPTAITLAAFTAQAGDDGVTLAWETATEVDNAGFNLYRALLQDGPYTQVNGALIAAQGDAASGASYSFLDAPGYGTYYYKLEDVDYHGVSTMHGPLQVTVARPLRRPLYRPTLPQF